MPNKREHLLEIMEDAARGETKATLRARIAELEAEVERLRGLFETQSDAHVKHVQGLLAQHAAERDIYGKAAQNFRERAEKAEALSRTGAVTGVWRMDKPPKDGTPIYMRTVSLMRFQPYKPASQQAKSGIKGRWQKMNDYGGWENCPEPVGNEWRFVSPFDPKAAMEAGR